MNIPPYPIFPVLRNDVVTLRNVLDSDLPELMEICFYDGKKAGSLEEAREMQGKINVNYQDGDTIHWAIVDNKLNQVVGTCGYYRGFANGAGELGCVLLPAFRGRNKMTPALQSAIEFGLKTMQLQRIWAATSEQNIPAIKLLERLGFQKTADLEEQHVEFEMRNFTSF